MFEKRGAVGAGACGRSPVTSRGGRRCLNRREKLTHEPALSDGKFCTLSVSVSLSDMTGMAPVKRELTLPKWETIAGVTHCPRHTSSTMAEVTYFTAKHKTSNGMGEHNVTIVRAELHQIWHTSNKEIGSDGGIVAPSTLPHRENTWGRRQRNNGEGTHRRSIM